MSLNALCVEKCCTIIGSRSVYKVSPSVFIVSSISIVSCGSSKCVNPLCQVSALVHVGVQSVLILCVKY